MFLTTSLLLFLCKRGKKKPSDDVDSEKESTKQRETQTQKDAELESQLLELLEQLSDSDKKKKRKGRKKKKQKRGKLEKNEKKRRRRGDGPEDAPRKIPLNEKEMRIAKGLKVASGDYPTMDNVKSDWDPE
ncbi:hypothetical protein GCK72_010991 [Caenorhabditis remanei]|uniref:Uncharacterized protein n=1 Tax=Caenorhabditis remanei TaxID=31234 RepID=A0A6A5H6P1_CAERE|nr:hypothetical protein GCK72_010991 [Caenorhabditis remanei]KAF1762729.1 hypothetical protein GCK72_010991 [Caenorhabditis remanei]